MPGYGQFCPVARASEIFAERWTPLILREIVSGRHHYNEILKGLHSISPSILGDRLRNLERVGVIEARPNPAGRGSTYHLTQAGSQLAQLVSALGVWGQQYLELKREQLDPDYLMWALYKHLEIEKLPTRRSVIRFSFRGGRNSYWLVLQRPDPDLCYADPGFGEDLVIDADLEALTRVYLGELTLKAAMRAGLVALEGSRSLIHTIDEWFPISSFASSARPVRYDPVAHALRPSLAR